MKDLIKEIESNKLLSNEIREDFKKGFNSGLALSQQIIKSYNLIIAPKQIKLSEILGKLNNNEWKDFQITRQDNIISIDNNNNFRQYFNIDKNKITDISEEMQDNEFKWLYTLWIAGSEIIDDLKEKE